MIFAGKRPTHLGVKDGQLTPCPKALNCVCSQSSDALHQIEPLRYTSTPEAAITDLKTLIQSRKRTQIITERDRYIHAEFQLPVVGFIDDVEFYVDEATQTIHVRSASRLGKYDLGVNRKRIETLRTKWQQLHQS